MPKATRRQRKCGTSEHLGHGHEKLGTSNHRPHPCPSVTTNYVPCHASRRRTFTCQTFMLCGSMLQRTLQQLSASVKQNPAFLLRRALTVPALRALIASLVLYLGAFSYCRQRFWRDPHSAFFQSETVYDLHYSLARQAEVQRFIQRANTSDPATQERFLRAQADPLLCAAITTVRREPVQYLADAVGSLLEGLYPEERTALYSYILFANTEPSVHPDWNATWTAGLVDAAETYNVTHEELEHLRKVEEDRNFYVKGVLYVWFRTRQTFTEPHPG